MFGSTAVLIANSEPQFITKPRTATVIYHSTPNTSYTKSWLFATTLYRRIDSHIEKSYECNSHLEFTKKFPARFTHHLSTRKTDKPVSSQLTFSGFTTLPYIKGVSDKIKRILLKNRCKSVIQIFLTIGRFLSFLKDQMHHDDKSNLVYEVFNKDCALVYIAQTKRDFKFKITKHQRAIKFQWPDKLALCQHLMKDDHLINWSKSNLLKSNMIIQSVFLLKVGISMKKPQEFNRNGGLVFRAIYRKLLNSQS